MLARLCRNCPAWRNYWRWTLLVPLLLLPLLCCLVTFLMGGIGTGAARLNQVSGAIAGKPTEISGVAAPNECILIFDGPSNIGQAVADAGGSFKYLADLAAGNHSITIKSCGNNNGYRAGELSVAPLSVNVAAAPFAALPTPVPPTPAPPPPTAVPTVVVPTVIAKAIVPDFVIPMIGSLKDGAKIDLGKLGLVEGIAASNACLRLFDENTLLADLKAAADGTWSFDASKLAAGAHRFILRQCDDKGNIIGVGAPVAFTLGDVIAAAATVAPKLVVTPTTATSIVVPIGGIVVPGAPLGGKCVPGAQVEVFDGTTLLGTVPCSAGGDWVFNLPANFTPGSHTIRAVSIDKDGKTLSESTATMTVSVGASTPVPVVAAATTIVVPAGAGVLPGAQIGGKCVPNAQVQVFDGATLLGTVPCSEGGDWTFALPTTLSAGAHTIRAVLIDKDGKKLSESTATITIGAAAATPAPVAIAETSILPPIGGNMQAGALLRGKCVPNAQVQVFDGTTLIGTVPCSAGGDWLLAVPLNLTAGAHTMRAVSVDKDKKKLGEGAATVNITSALLPVTGASLEDLLP